KGLSRRNLFKYMGAGGAATVAAACDQKPEKLIPMLVPPTNFEYTPQTAYQYMTTCGECDSGCGMMMTVRENRAQKAEGNPLHPINKGALCSRGQASLQTLYNPNRISKPFLHGKNITWDEGQKLFNEKLQDATGKVVYLGKPLSGSDKIFFEEWFKAIGGGKRVAFQLFDQQGQRNANSMCFGQEDVPDLAFEKAKIIYNFGADFLETWGRPVENARRLSESNAFDGKTKTELVHLSPHVSLTGAKADRWVVINPGSEAMVALSIASVIHNQKGGYEFLSEMLAAFAPEKVAKATGVPAKKMKELAQKFIENSPGLALGGGPSSRNSNLTSLHVAINILNAVSGNLGKTVFFHDQPAPENTSHQNLVQLIEDLKAGKVDLLIVDDSDPLHALPNSTGIKEAMKNTFTVSLASQKNDTSSEADLQLPALTDYESWGDAFPRSGVRSIRQPVMAPVSLFEAKAREDVMLAAAKALNPESFEGISDYRDFIRKEWQNIQQESGNRNHFDQFWVKVLEEGGLFSKPNLKSVSLKDEVGQLKIVETKISGTGLTLIPTTSLFHGDGRGARNPWLQEVPDPMSQIVWDSWMEINPDTAKKMGIKDRSVVQLKTSQGSIKATAFYHFGIHRDAVAIPIGQGHENSGDVADGFGVNVMNLLPTEMDESGSLALVTTRAELNPVEDLSYTVNLDGNARQLGRNIAAATTIDELNNSDHHKSKPHFQPHELEFYPPRSETAGYYKPYRWGMTIDLDRCNGCSACIVACYAENNIPVVGKIRSAIGREMSWIRMERYIEGYGDDFEVRFVPMMCQQCSNAGCEPVCPVYATYHNPEGLNAMIYNRCVGTRYCSNNCSYKVRRFNWFNYEFPAPLDQQLNSTITTRSVGVMEKCNFCQHRLVAAKHEASNLGRDVQDGEVLTACQQTCATKAITFGNLMDENSQVSKNAKINDKEHRDRQYEVLPELNFQPAVTYMKKVNTRVAGGGKHGHNTSHG
ncbi:MAG: molybdopterin dinucleotide binding domain-containing protein, partial [SAR324 cluster bacterium]|nr:molybdopterin dinucleotide binding domain-containing protein [SAR324 cluster bacterium]